jgi:hypothetical protein
MGEAESNTNTYNTDRQDSSFASRTSAANTKEDRPESIYNLEAYIRKIKVIEERFDGAEEKSKEVTEKIGTDLNNAQESLELKITELKNDQLNVIQTLSIFVAFFTFVSVEFKVLTSTASDISQVTGFTLILLGALTFFVLLIDFVLNTKLSFNKTVNHRPEASFFRQISKFASYTEDIPFKLFSPSSWGDAFKVKFLPLFTASVLLIAGGVLLVSKDMNEVGIIVIDEPEITTAVGVIPGPVVEPTEIVPMMVASTTSTSSSQ